jgi:threonine dehydrogenase-like Zn-dependent dehydrogenase
MSVLLALKAKGAKKIFVTDKIDARLAMAKKSGASLTGNPEKEIIVAKIEKVEPALLEIVFECCGQQEAVDQAIDLLKPGGKLLIIGIPEFDHWSFSVDKLRRKEICIQNIRRQNHSVEETLDLISGKKVDVSTMATHRFNFKNTKHAFDLVAAYKDGVMKAMIDFD